MSIISEKFIADFCQSGRIVVYGYLDCRWVDLHSLLQENVKAYCWTIGAGLEGEYKDLTRNKITPIPDPIDREDTKRVCKTALLHLILDNYRRRLKGNEITPLLFCIDIDNNLHIPPNARRIFSKEGKSKNLFTHRELRRIAKICFDPKLDGVLRNLALETFHFIRVKVEVTSNGELLGAEEIPMPFTKDEALNYLAKRNKKALFKPNRLDWRALLEERRREIFYQYQSSSSESNDESSSSSSSSSNWNM